MFNRFIAELEAKLKSGLPGENAQYIMAPESRKNYIHIGNYIHAGVLLLIFPIENVPNFVLMKRPEYNGVHSGQISLPGGKSEPVDLNIEQTALRETYEEMGVSSNNIKIIGKLTSLKVPVSGFEIFPFVGYTEIHPIWSPDPLEVEKIIEVPLKTLLNDSVLIIETWNLQGSDVKVPFYLLNNEKVWGATAMILSEFVSLLKT